MNRQKNMAITCSVMLDILLRNRNELDLHKQLLLHQDKHPVLYGHVEYGGGSFNGARPVRNSDLD